MSDSGEKKKPILNLDPELRRVVLAIGYMLIAAGVIIALRLIWPALAMVINVLLPFLVAMVVAYIFNPIVTFVQRQMKLSRLAGVFAVNIIVASIVIGFVAIVIPILVTQVRSAWTDTRSATEQQVIPWVNNLIIDLPGHEDLETINDYETFHDSRSENLGDVATRKELAGFIGEWQEETRLQQDKTDGFREVYLAWFDSQTSESLPIAQLKEPFDAWKVTAEQEHPVTWGDFEERIDELLAMQNTSIEDLLSRAAESSQVRSATRSAAEGGAGFFGRIFTTIASVLMSLVNSVIFLIFVVILAFYLLLDFSSMRGVVEVLTPMKYQEKVFSVMDRTDIAVGGYIRGQLIVATIVGVITFLGLWALGLKQYALLIGFIAGIGNLVPYLGPIAGATPAILYMLLTDSFDVMTERLIYLGLTAALFGIIQMLESLVLQPRIVGNSAELHPIAVILALAFGAVFGIMGMIVAVPVACIIRVLWKELYWDERVKKWRDRSGKLRLDDPGPPIRKEASS